LVGWLEFNVPFRHKYGYIRDEIWILMKQEMMGWQWHRLDHYANRLHLAADGEARQHRITQSFRGRMLFLTPNQQCQSTEGSQNTEGRPSMSILIIISCIYSDDPAK